MPCSLCGSVETTGGCINLSCPRHSYTPPVTGWRCPNCGAGLAPTVEVCPLCRPQEAGHQVLAAIHTDGHTTQPCPNCHALKGHTIDCVEGYELWDGDNKLVRCTPGTATCYEIGNWLGIEALQVAAILNQNRARTVKGKIGVAVWRMADGEEKTSRSYSLEFKDFLVNEAIRKHLIGQGVRHGGPERMKRYDEA